jgi:hypothetical protein
VDWEGIASQPILASFSSEPAEAFVRCVKVAVMEKIEK